MTQIPRRQEKNLVQVSEMPSNPPTHNKSELSIYYYNVSGVGKNTPYLLQLLKSEQYDIVALVESSVTHTVGYTVKKFSDKYYFASSPRFNQSHGGIIIFIKKEFYFEINAVSQRTVEFLALTIHAVNYKLMLLIYYQRPFANTLTKDLHDEMERSSMSSMENVLLEQHYNNILVMGDLNGTTRYLKNEHDKVIVDGSKSDPKKVLLYETFSKIFLAVPRLKVISDSLYQLDVIIGSLDADVSLGYSNENQINEWNKRDIFHRVFKIKVFPK